MPNLPEWKRPGIGDGLRRLLDQRTEQRTESKAQTAVLNHRGHRHVVRVTNVSASGAMIAFSGNLARGEEISLQLVDQGEVSALVRWVLDGRVGVSFSGRSDPASED